VCVVCVCARAARVRLCIFALYFGSKCFVPSSSFGLSQVSVLRQMRRMTFRHHLSAKSSNAAVYYSGMSRCACSFIADVARDSEYGHQHRCWHESTSMH